MSQYSKRRNKRRAVLLKIRKTHRDDPQFVARFTAALERANSRDKGSRLLTPLTSGHEAGAGSARGRTARLPASNTHMNLMLKDADL